MAASDNRLERLLKYVSDLKSKLQDGIPEKHKTHPESYKTFLNREIESTTKKIESMRLDGGKK